MTVPVPFDGRTITVEARWRLALAVAPVEALTGLPSAQSLHVSIEPARPRPPRPSRGRTITPAPRFDERLPRNRSGTFTLVHRLGRPEPPGDPVREVVVRIVDPARGSVPRRLRVPVWSLRQVARSDAGSPEPFVPASARSVAPALFPGAAFVPPGGCTGMRGRLLRYGEALRWARITAVGPLGTVLGRAHGDARGEFLLVLATTGTDPMPQLSRVAVRLLIRAPAPFGLVPDPADPSADPLADLLVEDAVLRGPGTGPGEIDTAVLRGERDPAGYVLVPERPTVELAMGVVTAPPPLIVT